MDYMQRKTKTIHWLPRRNRPFRTWG